MSGFEPTSKSADTQSSARVTAIRPPVLLALAGQEAVTVYARFYHECVKKTESVHFEIAVPEFLNFCSEQNIRSMVDIEQTHIDDYRRDLEQAGRPDTQIELRFRALSEFFTALEASGVLPVNPLPTLRLVS